MTEQDYLVDKLVTEKVQHRLTGEKLAEARAKIRQLEEEKRQLEAKFKEFQYEDQRVLAMRNVYEEAHNLFTFSEEKIATPQAKRFIKKLNEARQIMGHRTVFSNWVYSKAQHEKLSDDLKAVFIDANDELVQRGLTE